MKRHLVITAQTAIAINAHAATLEFDVAVTDIKPGKNHVTIRVRNAGWFSWDALRRVRNVRSCETRPSIGGGAGVGVCRRIWGLRPCCVFRDYRVYYGHST